MEDGAISGVVTTAGPLTAISTFGEDDSTLRARAARIDCTMARENEGASGIDFSALGRTEKIGRICFEAGGLPRFSGEDHALNINGPRCAVGKLGRGESTERDQGKVGPACHMDGREELIERDQGKLGRACMKAPGP